MSSSLGTFILGFNWPYYRPKKCCKSLNMHIKCESGLSGNYCESHVNLGTMLILRLGVSVSERAIKRNVSQINSDHLKTALLLMLILILHVQVYLGLLTQTFKYISYPCSGTLLNKISPIASVVSTFKLSLQENTCLSKKAPKTDQIFSQMVSCIFKVFQRIKGSFQQHFC